MALLCVSGGWFFKGHTIVPLLLRLLQSKWGMKALRPIKIASTTHTAIRRHITQSQILQQHRFHNITYLELRCLRSNSYDQVTCMWCYFLITLSSVFISSLDSVRCATEPSTYHSTFSYSKINFSFGCLTFPQQFTVTHDLSYLHLSLRTFDILRSVPFSQ